MLDKEQTVKALKWLAFVFPWQENPKSKALILWNAIHKYASDAAALLEEQEPV